MSKDTATEGLTIYPKVEIETLRKAVEGTLPPNMMERHLQLQFQVNALRNQLSQAGHLIEQQTAEIKKSTALLIECDRRLTMGADIIDTQADRISTLEYFLAEKGDLPDVKH